jgi:hypothetical protein
MNFQSVNLRKTNPVALRQLVSAGSLAVHSKAEGKRLQALIQEAWATTNFVLIRNALVVGLHLDAASTFQTLRRKGLLRYYGYVGKKCIVNDLATELLVELPHLSQAVSLTDRNYLESVQRLGGLRAAYVTIDTRIMQEADSFGRAYPQRSLLKTLLAYADSLFLYKHYPAPDPTVTGVASRSKEEVAAAVSFLLHTITERRPTTTRTLTFISDDYITSGRITAIVENACLLDDLRESELLVEHYQYQCISQEGSLRLVPPTEMFARSLNLGYIRTELQAAQDAPPETEAASMADLITQVMAHKELIPFSLAINAGYSRYRLALAEPLFEYIAETLFKPDALFQEEIAYLSHIFKEQQLDYEHLTRVLVRDNLTLLDFVKLQRVFRFLYRLFAAYLSSMSALSHGLVLRSLIPVLTEPQLYEALDKLAPADKVETYLDLVCWEPGLPFLFDMQYHPILYIEQQFLLPMSILAQSNYLRNLFASEYKRGTKTLVTDGTRDLLVARLADTFRQAGLQCFEQVDVPGSDLDLLVVYDDVLFLLECKYSLLPVSAFDLRTTYDYLRKAETQLDHLLALNANGELIPVLEKKCGLDLTRPWRIVPGIVLGNRMFNGNALRYPVRNVHEMRNFVQNGTIRTKDGVFSLWQGTKLTVSDLIDFFSLENELVEQLHSNLSVRTVTYAVDKFHLEKEDYYLAVQEGTSLLAAYTDRLPKIADKSLPDEVCQY